MTEGQSPSFNDTYLWSPYIPLNLDYGGYCSPTVINLGSSLFMAFRANDEIYYAQCADGIWGPCKRAQGSDGQKFGTASEVSLAALQSGVLMVWRGANKNQNIWYSTFTFKDENKEEYWSPQRTAAADGVEFATSVFPYVVPVGKKSVMVWKGVDNDSRLFISSYSHEGNAWTAQTILQGPDNKAFSSSCRPSIIFAGSYFLLMWSDGGCNYYSRSLPRDEMPPRAWSLAQPINISGSEPSTTLVRTMDGLPIVFLNTYDVGNIFQATLDPLQPEKGWTAPFTVSRNSFNGGNVFTGETGLPCRIGSRSNGPLSKWICYPRGDLWSSAEVANSSYTSAQGPAVVNAGSSLFMAWVEPGSTEICYAQSSADGWEGKKIAGGDGGTFAAGGVPALALGDAAVFMVWRGVGSDTNLYHATYDLDAGQWDNPSQARSPFTVFKSDCSPSVAAIGGQIVMVWRNPADGTIQFSAYNPGWASWRDSIPLSGTDKKMFATSGCPALIEFADSLFLAWKDTVLTNGKYALCCSQANPTNDDQPVLVWSSQAKAQFGAEIFCSAEAPGLAFADGAIMMVWKNADGTLRQSLTGATGICWAPSQPVVGAGAAFRSDGSPALFQGPGRTVMMAWADQKVVRQSLFGSAHNEQRRKLATVDGLGFWWSSWDGANWMKKLAADTMSKPKPFMNKGFKDWVMPGSHDAGMYNWFDGYASFLGKTQDKDINGQLECGSRYFDIRPRYDKSTGEIYIYHGPTWGPNVTEVLSSIEKFMTVTDHQEVVILKFSQFNDFDKPATPTGFAQYDKLKTLITTHLDKWLYKNARLTTRLADVPYKELLLRDSSNNVIGGRIILAMDWDLPSVPGDGFFLYRDGTDKGYCYQGDITVWDKYSDSLISEYVAYDQSAQYGKFDGVCADKTTPCDMFLLSWTVTVPTAVYLFALEANIELFLFSWFCSVPNASGKVPNIIYLDYVEWSSALDLAMEYNLDLCN